MLCEICHLLYAGEDRDPEIRASEEAIHAENHRIREEAILDGQLVDVSETAAKLGYRCQVAVTVAFRPQYIDNPAV